MKVNASDFGQAWMGMSGELETGVVGTFSNATLKQAMILEQKLYRIFKAESEADPNWPYELPQSAMEVDLTEEEADLLKEISGIEVRWDLLPARRPYKVAMNVNGILIDLEVYASDEDGAIEAVSNMVSHYLRIHGEIEEGN